MGKVTILSSSFLSTMKISQPLAGVWRDENYVVPEKNFCSEGSFKNIIC